MTVLRLWLTAGCVLSGAALGAGIVTAPPATTTSGDPVQVRVSVADESLSELPVPLSESAPVVPPPAAPPLEVAAPAAVVPVESPPARAPVRWAFTPNFTPERAHRSEMPESELTRAPSASSPAGSGGHTAVPEPPEGNVRDALTSAVRMAEQSRDVLGSLISGAVGD